MACVEVPGAHAFRDTDVQAFLGLRPDRAPKML